MQEIKDIVSKFAQGSSRYSRNNHTKEKPVLLQPSRNVAAVEYTDDILF